MAPRSSTSSSSFSRFGAFLLRRLAGIGLTFSLISVLACMFPRVSGRFFRQPQEYGCTTRRTLEWSQSPAPDLLFLGSSTCYLGVDPRELDLLGLSSFVLCSTSQTIGQSWRILQDIERQAKLPRYLVLDIYPELWRLRGSWTSTRDWSVNGYYEDELSYLSLLGLALSDMDPYSAVLALYYWQFRKSQPISHDRRPDTTGIYRERGFVAGREAALSKIPQKTPMVVEMKDHFQNDFKEMIEFCERRGIQLVILLPPELVRTKFKLPDFLERLPVIDGQEWPGSSEPQHFYDNRHLVESGAKVYSTWLVARLEQTLDRAIRFAR